MDTGRLPPDGELEDFKNSVRAYAKYDDDIRKMKTAIRERERAKAVLKPKIMGFMERFEVQDVNLAGGGLQGKIVLGSAAPPRPRPAKSPATVLRELREALPPEALATLPDAAREALREPPAPTDAAARRVPTLRRALPRHNPGTVNL